MNLFEQAASSDEELPLEHEITQLVDDYDELNSLHAFLLDSLTSAMSCQMPTREAYILGAKRCSEAIQAKGQQLKESLAHLHQRTRMEKRS